MNCLSLRNLSWLAWATTILARTPRSGANWDPSTGHVRDYKPTHRWLSKNREPISSLGAQLYSILITFFLIFIASIVTSDAIQVSECALNTRLTYPNVQLFAYFEVNHAMDCYHGCPYGICHAFTTFPQPDELEPSYTDGHSFFWHNLGGNTGANPQDGEYGWEGMNGVYHDGKPDYSKMQKNHDENYPLWAQRKSALKPWPAGAAECFNNGKSEPFHPKCGRPCESERDVVLSITGEPNKDPGSVPGLYGHYHPTPASEYFPPKGWRGSCDGYSDFQSDSAYFPGNPGVNNSTSKKNRKTRKIWKKE
ncbi:hypothetical protein VP01_3016g1 [Puccinia sorghi]|uniref:Uncharacterized protein n=1 Tax=Puccinia sorghi TaxID=27349 RepID=A0A0L6V062_9BASI|nr:hypothetical protein VP01_3016g1 [Puccinia sorghi]